LKEQGNPTDTWTATQWFRQTGELWSFDSGHLRDRVFYVESLAIDTARFLTRGLEMLKAFGASGLIRIEVGAVGLEGSQWAGQFAYQRSDAILDRVSVSMARRTWDEAAIADLLVMVTQRFGEAYGRAGLDEATIKRMIAGQ
jgi:hypothetical protein